MNKDVRNKIIVGIFVSIGIVIFSAGIYFIGAKKNMFTSTFTLAVTFTDVNGLEPGNNVRFRGLDVGTIKQIEIKNDSLVLVTLMIVNNVKSFIKKNSFVSIGTDGLMGNKVAIVRNGITIASHVDEGDTLLAINPIASEDIIRSLGNTAKSVSNAVNNLKAITGKINDSNGLWTMLHDSLLDGNLKQAVVSIKLIGTRGATIMGDLSQITQHINEGKGTLGALLTDTSLEGNLKQSVINIHLLSNRMAIVSGDLSNISGKINNGEGTIGKLLMDTSFVNNLNKSMQNIKNGSKDFSDDLEALKHSFLLRKYFKKNQARLTKNKIY